MGKQNYLKSNGQGGHPYRIIRDAIWSGEWRRLLVGERGSSENTSRVGGKRVIVVDSLYIWTGFENLLKLTTICSKILKLRR